MGDFTSDAIAARVALSLCRDLLGAAGEESGLEGAIRGAVAAAFRLAEAVQQ